MTGWLDGWMSGERSVGRGLLPFASFRVFRGPPPPADCRLPTGPFFSPLPPTPSTDHRPQTTPPPFSPPAKRTAAPRALSPAGAQATRNRTQ